MRLTAFALMAFAMLSADAEAKKSWKPKVITAKCKIPDHEDEDAIKGKFFLRERAYDKPIKVSGKVWNAQKREDFTAQLYYPECSSKFEYGHRFRIRERRGRKKSTILHGKIEFPLPSPVLGNFMAEFSLGLINMAGEIVACCQVTDIEDHRADDEDSDPVDQN